MSWQSIDWSLLFDELLVLAIATLNLLLALILRRRTAMGRGLAAHAFAIAALYYGALLGLHFQVFHSQPWRIAIRLLVALTTAYAIWAIVGHFGGWRETAYEIWRGLQELGSGLAETGQMARWRVRRLLAHWRGRN